MLPSRMIHHIDLSVLLQRRIQPGPESSVKAFATEYSAVFACSLRGRHSAATWPMPEEAPVYSLLPDLATEDL